jgi:hypothetical protein
VKKLIKKGLIAGVAILIVGLIFSFGLQALIPSYAEEYKTALFRPWTDPLMMAFFGYPFILGLVAAYLWDLVSSKFSGDYKKKAFEFAKLYFIIATIPGMFITLTTFNVSFLMVGVWTLTGFIEIFVAGLVFAKVK